MKTLSKTVFAVIILAISLGLFSCEKEETALQFQETWKYNQEVMIYDHNGDYETAVTIVIEQEQSAHITMAGRHYITKFALQTKIRNIGQ